MKSTELLQIVKKRCSVRAYQAGKLGEKELGAILEAARWAPSGANTQPWEFVVTRDRETMTRVREIFHAEWRERKREDPVNYKGLTKYYVGDASALVLVCGDPRTMQVYLTTRRPGDREKLFQASVASAVENMMLLAASLGFGTVWVSVREEVEPELRELFKVPQPIRLLWIVPIGRARFRPGAKPRRKAADFTHYECYDPKKLRSESLIRAWPKG
jgi:nitroreductase